MKTVLLNRWFNIVLRRQLDHPAGDIQRVDFSLALMLVAGGSWCAGGGVDKRDKIRDNRGGSSKREGGNHEW